MNLSFFTCSYESEKCGKEGKKLQKFENLNNEKSFLEQIKNIFRWGTHLYMPLPSILPSVYLSFAHHISGTVHRLVIIFATHV